MRFIQVLSVLVAGAAAQTSVKSISASTTGTACAAQNILDACLATETAILQNCQPLDWACQCEAQKLVLRCYDNCPTDVGKGIANSVLVSYCTAAGQSANTTTPSGSGSVVSAPQSSSSSASQSSSASPSSTGKTNAAPMMGTGNGLLVAAMGIAALI